MHGRHRRLWYQNVPGNVPPHVGRPRTFIRFLKRSLKKHLSGYKQWTKYPNHWIQIYMSVKETNNTVTTCIIYCSNVPTNQWPKQHSSSINQREFFRERHLLPMSSNRKLENKFPVIHIKYKRGIEIATSRTNNGTDNEWHTRTWRCQPELALTGYMIHHHLSR